MIAGSKKQQKVPTPKASAPVPAAVVPALPGYIPTAIRGLDPKQFAASATLPDRQRVVGFSPMNSGFTPIGITGVGPLEANDFERGFGPVGSYRAAGDRPSTATALTATGERWSGSSPTWIETPGGHVNIDRMLAGARGVLGRPTQTTPMSEPATSVIPAAKTPVQSAVATTSPKEEERRRYLAGLIDSAAKTGKLASIRGQLPTIANQLGLANLSPTDYLPSRIRSQMISPWDMNNLTYFGSGQFYS